ncbi:protein TolA [Paracoccus aestuariivivens]|uniref:Protein TolA n=1 Tax=Paracoccus aestuariivivens TaxID=1820333 RepID=A0A6L6JAD2_9RHOB|nr:protein TolA [Paracoccus aestuariivivens]MTH77689.1 protein TolA [Paracoccus aestuariivivens]
MDRADRIGYWVSGVAHAGLLGFAVVGGALFRPQPLEAIRMAEVSTMSEAEFQALASAAAGAGPVSDVAETTPAQPQPPADEVVAGAPEAQSPPEPDANAAALSRPTEEAEAQPDLSDFQNESRPVAVATLVPQPNQPNQADETAALPADAARPNPAREPAQTQSPAPVPQRSQQAPIESARPNGRPEGLAEAIQARREAAEAARQRELVLAREAEEAAAEEAAAKRRDEAAAKRAAEERAQDERREAARREEAESARKTAEADARARRQAAAEAADADARKAAEAAEKKRAAEQRAAEEKAAAAEKAAAEKAEADKREAAAKAKKEAEKKAAAEKAAEEKRVAEKKAAEKAAAEAKAKEKAEAERKAAEAAEKKAALAEAKKKEEGSAGAGGGGAAANGPPLSQGEKDGFRVAVEACWNRGSLSTEASRTKVSISFSMSPDGMPESGSLKMINHNGPSDAVAKQAYEAARRAILMCASRNGGYKLPAEKYNRWKDIVIDFNPSGSATIK